mmetsp:Transcript_16497/g.27260  ORF Transcript_16497/g.27260 Transcript_16497/m.27260 type:complete len:855 (+) Transcript_16497:110-2674(+)|eukprot:CAMPEP_0184646882 /NCGR_PEP_ID=MMETSP0308-20130426/3674_1 /TAXON_ID=38269 /ORGANISM="Gloeochaete witrockiana, Strain SAG 46.84" /LENGTH=854 /DNA_ID=CAMNT_0027077327 /DNA_START=109 /DNA_END=2673 /DNA_ORIENTATION=-
MADITTILLNGLKSELREASEQHLKWLETQDFPRFLLTLCEELANNDKPADSRRLAGIIVKNALGSKEDSRKTVQEQQWAGIDPQIKARIKQLVLSTLPSPTKEARHTAAQVVAKIAAIELPKNEWPELIAILLQNMTTAANDFLKQSTLESLGFICEEIDSAVLEAQSNQILTAVVQGMRKEEPNDEVKLAATKSLYNSLEFVKNNFENEEERNYIMQVCIEAALSADVHVRVSAFECLVKIASLYYDKLFPYMQTLLNLTFKAIKQDDEQVAQQGVEFWSTICDEEIDLQSEAEEAMDNNETPERSSKQFIKGALKYLVPLLLETMTRQEEDQDEDAWNVSMAAGTCLALVANTVGSEVVQYVMPFVQQNIKNPDWHFRESATLSFGSILEGPDKANMTPLINEAIPILIQALTDSNILVKDTTAWTLGRICDFHATSIQKAYLPTMMDAFVVALHKDNEPRVAGNICWAIHNFAQAFEDHADDPSNDLSPFFIGLVKELLDVTERDDAAESNLRSSAYEAINVLIQNAARDVFVVLAQIIPPVIERLEKTFSMQIVSADDREEQIELQALLCGVLQIIIQKLGKNIVPFADRLMTLFLQVFSARHATVHEEALMAVGALANAIEGDFQRYMEPFAPFLNLGLRNWEEHQVCAVAVGVVGDVCRALEAKIAPFCDEIVTLLLQDLQNPHLNRNVKPPLISAFGDIALAIGGQFEKYLHVVMGMLTQASEVEVPMDDYDLVEYLNQLRESIFEAYTGILQGLKTDKRAEAFIPYVEKVMEFIKRVAQDANRFEAVTRACVGVIGDLASAIGPQVANPLRQDFVKTLLKDSVRSQDSQTVETAKWAKEVIKNLQ